MTGNRVMKLWTVILTAFLAVLAGIGIAPTATAAAPVPQRGEARNTGTAPADEQLAPENCWTPPSLRSLPPTMRQRIMAEMHGAAPRCRRQAPPSDTAASAPSDTTPGTTPNATTRNRAAVPATGAPGKRAPRTTTPRRTAPSRSSEPSGDGTSSQATTPSATSPAQATANGSAQAASDPTAPSGGSAESAPPESAPSESGDTTVPSDERADTPPAPPSNSSSFVQPGLAFAQTVLQAARMAPPR